MKTKTNTNDLIKFEEFVKENVFDDDLMDSVSGVLTMNKDFFLKSIKNDNFDFMFENVNKLSNQDLTVIRRFAGIQKSTRNDDLRIIYKDLLAEFVKEIILDIFEYDLTEEEKDKIRYYGMEDEDTFEMGLDEDKDFFEIGTEEFLNDFSNNYDIYYYEEEPEDDIYEEYMEIGEYFVNQSTTNKNVKNALEMFCLRRQDMLSSDREFAAFGKTLVEYGLVS